MNSNGCINLANKTTIQDLCCLARDAQFAIGNDTGPMHIFSLSGCQVMVLFSNDSNPIRCAPRSVSKKKLVKISIILFNNYSEPFDLIIYDIKGRIVVEHNNYSSQELNISKLNAGIYFMQINNSYTQKLIKK